MRHGLSVLSVCSSLKTVCIRDHTRAHSGYTSESIAIKPLWMVSHKPTSSFFYTFIRHFQCLLKAHQSFVKSSVSCPCCMSYRDCEPIVIDSTDDSEWSYLLEKEPRNPHRPKAMVEFFTLTSQAGKLKMSRLLSCLLLLRS